jgi:arylsulfatase
MTGMSENAFINVKNRSVSITAELEIPKGGANGVVLPGGAIALRPGRAVWHG